MSTVNDALNAVIYHVWLFICITLAQLLIGKLCCIVGGGGVKMVGTI